MPDRFVVARASELPPGERLLVEVDGRSIGIFNVGGELFAIVNRCPHMGAEMCRGHVVPLITSTGPGDVSYDRARHFLVCPWHGWEYDLRTGQSYLDPRTVRIRTYAVSVAEGGPLAAELAEGAVSREGVRAASAPPPDAEVHGRVAGPYRAETIDVSVEDEYVVVDLRPRRPERTGRPA